MSEQVSATLPLPAAAPMDIRSILAAAAQAAADERPFRRGRPQQSVGNRPGGVRTVGRE